MKWIRDISNSFSDITKSEYLFKGLAIRVQSYGCTGGGTKGAFAPPKLK